MIVRCCGAVEPDGIDVQNSSGPGNQLHSAQIQRGDRGSAAAAEWITENRQSLNRSIVHLEETLASLKTLVERSGDKLDRSLAQFDSASAQLQALAGNLRDFTDNLNEGKGTLGRLATDPELYNRLNTTAANLDSLIRKIRKRGLTTRIVLF